MNIIETEIPGLIILEPKIFEDTRGCFFESYNKSVFEKLGIKNEFVQDNQSLSVKGVLRGLHFQREPYSQAKLVRVLSGSVLDVAVDLRKGSPTYGRWQSEVLSAENRRQMYIPRGFAHGFLVLSETAEFFYKCDNFYSREHDGGIRYDDPALNINWNANGIALSISEKDRVLPALADIQLDFQFQP